MSSLKMTFSLTSLILIFALAAIPAMAHDLDTGTPGLQHAATGGDTLTAAEHTAQHMDAPTVESVELVDVMVGTASTVSGNDVTLVDDVSAATPALADGAAAAEFLVKITFSHPLYGGIDSTTLIDGAAVTLTVTAAAQSASSNDLFATSAGAGAVSAAAVSADDPTTTDTEATTGKVFYATFTVGENLFGGDTGDASDLPIDVWVTVNANAGFVTTGLINGTTTYGTANTASMREKFTVVNEFTPDLPVVEVSVPDDASLTAPFTATFSFSKAVPELTIGDITIEPAGSAAVAAPKAVDDDDDSATDPNMEVWEAKIFPDPAAAATEIMIGVAPTKATMKMDADDMDIGTATVPVPGQVAMGTISVPAMSYVVVVPPMADTGALPDGLMVQELAGFVDLHGYASTTGLTIDVTSPSGGAANSVIITEIMVAADTGRIGMTGMDRPAAGQWIELYNTTDTATTVNIAFATGFPAAAKPMGSVDRFSNVASPGGWNFTSAFGAALTGTTEAAATGTGRVVTKAFNSLRRVHKDGKRLGETGADIQDGTKQGTWALTANTRVFLPKRFGTPGAENRPMVFTPAKFTPPTMSVTFNEIANRSSGDDWIELKGAADTNLKKYKIDIVTEYKKDANEGVEKKIYHFPDADVKIPASGILLLVKQSPTNTELAADKEQNIEKPVRYRIASDMVDLPTEGNFLLVLRDQDGKILDVAGYLENLDDDDPYRTLYPLDGNAGTVNAKNKLVGGAVYHRAQAVQGYSQGANADAPAFAKAGFTGMGYDRSATVTDENNGTPGYPNNVQIGDGAAATDNIIISEIMYGGPKNKLAQWIELYNMSATNSIHLNGWKLYIVNHSNPDFMGKVLDEVSLSSLQIPPKQTALIVSRANSHNTRLPSSGGHRILNRRLDKNMLSTTGFHLRLVAKPGEADAAKRQPGDEAGNLIEFDETDRPDHQAYAEPAWVLPSGLTEDGRRVSISRKIHPKIKELKGMKKWHWIPSDEDNRVSLMGVSTYYGRNTDIGSPGQTRGEALPVSLSKFRPERLKESGEIVVRWITESELNNAGFNILRSDKRDGEFTKVHFRAGQGTTSERTVYEWKDTSAKPNVVYYYQIQDVSLDGEVTTLRTTHLRGNVTAAGKATTTWGEIKALQ